MNKPFKQVEFIVTLSKDGEFMTTTLSINTNKFTKLFEYPNIGDSEIVSMLLKASIDWFETKNIAIFNFWFKDSYEGYYDEDGMFHFSE